MSQKNTFMLEKGPVPPQNNHHEIQQSHIFTHRTSPETRKHESCKLSEMFTPMSWIFSPPPFKFLAFGPIFRWLFVSGKRSIVWTQAATSQDSPTSLGLHKQQRTWAWDPRHLKKYEGGIGGHTFVDIQNVPGIFSRVVFFGQTVRKTPCPNYF